MVRYIEYIVAQLRPFGMQQSMEEKSECRRDGGQVKEIIETACARGGMRGGMHGEWNLSAAVANGKCSHNAALRQLYPVSGQVNPPLSSCPESTGRSKWQGFVVE